MKFLYPVPPDSTVTQTFQRHVERANANHWQYYYGGIDWGINTGTPIKAAQKGTITVTRKDAGGYGTHVRIQHAEGHMTLYGHLQKYIVSENDEVQAGEVIGYSDSTGNSTGPHLHFELRLENVPIDPAPLLVTTVEELGEEEGEEEEEEITEPEFPALPQAKITASVLNIRNQANTTGKVVGTLLAGTQVDVIDTILQDGNLWMHIGYNQYAAMLFGGSQLAEWI